MKPTVFGKIQADEFVGTSSSKGIVVPSLTSDPSSPSTAEFWFNSTTSKFKGYDGSSAINVSGESGGGGVGSLDDTYSNGQSITVDEGAIALTDSTTGALNTLQITKDGAGSGNVLDFSVDAALTGDAIAIDMNLGIAARGIFIDNGATARTGTDIQIQDDSTGAHTSINIDSSGSGASTGYAWTGSFNGSPGGNAMSLTFDNTDNLDTGGLLITRGTGVRTGSAIAIAEGSTGSANVIDVNVTGVYTGNVLDITTSAAATGNMINIDLDSAVAGTGLHIEGSGVRTQPMLEIITDSTSSADLIDISVDGAITGDAIAIDMNLGLAAKAINIDAGNGVRTDDLIGVTFDGTGNTDVMSIVATNTGSGAIFDINMDGTQTGEVFNVDMNAAVGAALFNIDAGAGTRTKDLIDVTFDGDGNVGYLDINCTNTGSGNLIDIATTGIHTGNMLNLAYSTAASTGDAINISMDTNVAGSALVIAGANARTDDLIKIDDSGTGSGHIFDINFTGIYTGNGLDITYATAAATGNAIDLNMGTNVAGMAIDISSAGTGVSNEGSCFNVAHTGDLVAGADVMRLSSTGNISSTSNVLSIVQATGAGTAGAYGLHVNCGGTNVEAAHFEAGEVYVEEALRYVQKAETVTSANVITASESGSIFFLNSATEFASTLPAPAAGLHYKFIITGAPSGANYTITTNASANIILGIVHEGTGGDGDSETSGADTINFVDGTSTVGDMVEVWCDGTNWFAQCLCDAAGAITITTAS